MTLHIGDNKTVDQRDIVAILPGSNGKSRILLANGQVLLSDISVATLRKRLSEALFIHKQ